MFQQKVIEKYLSRIDEQVLTEKYALFCSIFGNKAKQDNIRDSKEEQYQEGFIRDLFCSVLGYTIKPEANYNIFTEAKNKSKSSKKADGAIIINDEVKAVIELKGTDTQDLDKVAFQAFSYKNHHEKCNYVIVSNFERLRLYIETQIEYQEFNLFNLTKKDFNLLYLLLSLPQITNDTPLKLKHETLTEEKEITDKFYVDYSTFKRNLFEDLVKNNPDVDKLVLFKKTQKLLDRILFVLFCEDRDLLPTNSTMGIIKDYKKLKELGYYQPLYNIFKTFFDRIDKGFKHETDNSKDVFAYNGGLFKPDEILDSVKVGDDVLYVYSQKLANYDFESQISVDILGRIFENSLTEIEEVQKEIENEKNGIKTDTPNISKRKKDGVFYTPAYITKYIVENTIGKLCEAKKEELKINDNEFAFDKKYQRKKIEELDERLNNYREWLLGLKILDCACGSGAFLNAALKELRKEHTLIDYLWAKIHKNELNFSQIDNTILENNLYGVDINEDSIEITKLSLWLNTTTRNRKLTTLNDKIKCGNSLIDDESVAGEKAFNWQKEFPEVFEKGGFDVVISNPPYVNAIELKKSYKEDEYNFLKTHYRTAKGTVDLYIYFFERGIGLLKENGLLSFITPNRYLSASYGKALREYILSEKSFYRIIDYSDKKVFPDASTYPVITFIRNSKMKDDVVCGKFDDNHNFISKDFPSDKLNILEDSILGFLLNDKLAITEKIISQSVPLSNVGEINATSTAKEADIFSKFIIENSNNGYKLINTGTIDPYITKWGYSALTKQGQQYIYPYFSKDEKEITENRRKLYASKKIIISKIGLICEAFFDKNGEYASIDTNCIHSFNKAFLPEYILCYLNSKLFNYMFECFFDGLRMAGGYLLYSSPNLKNTYIKEISLEAQKPFIELADKMLALNEDLQKKINRFLSRIKETYNIEKITQNLESFYNLSFADFIKELSKQKVKLTMKQKDELEDYFNEYVKDISALNETIEKTDKEINTLVYNLYNLTEDEIKIIENN